MFVLQLFLLVIVGIIGIIFNWLLILAIQRKTYHYQHVHRIPTPKNISILGTNVPSTGQTIQPPLLPSVQSSISIFDKFILAFLINDIFVCNFLLPLRFLDLSQGLPCGFLCFLFKFLEKLTTTIELIITNQLIITSLIYFWKKRLLTTKLWFILIIITTPIIISCLITTLTYLEVDESQDQNRPPTCRQTFVYVNSTTDKTLNTFSCLVTYLIIFINFILLIKTKYAIRIYNKNALRSLTEGAVSARTEASSSDQLANESHRRRSMYYAASITMESSITSTTSPTHRSTPTIDYNTYLAVMENSRTLIRSTCLILLIYLLVHIPYWTSEFSSNQFLGQLKDAFFLCHVVKPFCYMLTNEQYRHHALAILQCKTFRMLPNILRRKSRLLTLTNNNSFSIGNSY